MKNTPFERICNVVARILGRAQRREQSLSERFPGHSFGRGTYGDDLWIRSWGEGARLHVGSFTSIASGVQIFLGGEHRPDWVTTFPFNVLWPAARGIPGHPKTKGDVVIGSDVWIGSEALIFSGVTIGNGAVVGARAVVTRNVAPYAIVAGNPARLVRSRFPTDIVEALLAVSWWNWPDSVIERALPELLAEDIRAFILKANAGGYGNEPQTSMGDHLFPPSQESD